MSDIPKGVYLAKRRLEGIEFTLPVEAKHICIDKDPLSQLVLRLTLGLQGILPSQAPKLFGYYLNNQFFFLNEEQHNYIKSLRDSE